MEELAYNLAMLLLILAALVMLVYGIYRATCRWGSPVLYYLAAGICALQASGVVAEHLWGPRYSWNFAHHTWDSLPATLFSFCFYIGMAVLLRNRHTPRPH